MVDRLSHALTPRILASGPHAGRRITTQALVTASIFSLTHVHLVNLPSTSSARAMPVSSASSALSILFARLRASTALSMLVPWGG